VAPTILNMKSLAIFVCF